MISISDRLKRISANIEKGETMADIGTDHGFLPLYLYETGRCPRVIMTDISMYSLEKARENTKRYYEHTSTLFKENSDPSSGHGDHEDNIIFRVGDGISVLDNGEVDVVVMAGIGGNLICDILKDDPEKSRSFSKYVLQPRRHAGILRHFLLNNGFIITGENLVREGKFICEIIIARPADKTEITIGGPERFIMSDEMMMTAGKSIIWEVPFWYADPKEPLAEEYIRRKLDKEKMILRSKSDSIIADTEDTEYNIMYLEKLLVKQENAANRETGNEIP